MILETSHADFARAFESLLERMPVHGESLISSAFWNSPCTTPGRATRDTRTLDEFPLSALAEKLVPMPVVLSILLTVAQDFSNSPSTGCSATEAP
jgi:hypothetical protein